MEECLKFIDLFCGIGGFHQALYKLNFQCVFACDIDKKCREIYEKNYGICPEGDIKNIKIQTIPKFDILCAGFPCQPFSKAGKQNGFSDERGNLFFDICNIVKQHSPKYLILENVRNLATHDFGNTWTVIKKNIDELGYYTYETPLILNVLHFNIPQNRERVVILCQRKDLGMLPETPNIPKNPKKYITCNVSDVIISDPNNSKYNIDEKMKIVETVWNEFIKILIDNDVGMPKYPIWTDWWDCEITDLIFYDKYKNWIDKNRIFYEQNKNILKDWLDKSRNIPKWIGAIRKFEWQCGDLKSSDSMNSVLWCARSSGIRVKKLNYIPTLVAMNTVPIYGPESRKLSPKELLKTQSFSETFQYDEKTILKQLGNSVNVKMIEKCARFLIFKKNLF